MTFKKGNNWNKGKKLSKEHIKHMSEALKEHYKTHVSPLKGRKLSDERRHEI